MLKIKKFSYLNVLLLSLGGIPNGPSVPFPHWKESDFSLFKLTELICSAGAPKAASDPTDTSEQLLLEEELMLQFLCSPLKILLWDSIKNVVKLIPNFFVKIFGKSVYQLKKKKVNIHARTFLPQDTLVQFTNNFFFAKFAATITTILLISTASVTTNASSSKSSKTTSTV